MLPYPARLATVFLGYLWGNLPCAGFNVETGTCEASSNAQFCSMALDRNLSSSWASTAPAPQWLEARIEGGEYVALGSYAITSVPGRPDLAPTAWRLEGLEPFSLNRQTLDEVYQQTWEDGTTHIRDLGGLTSWRSYQLTMLEGTGTQVAIAELHLMPKLGYEFEISSWAPCSVTCGGGTQNRTVVCKDSDGVSYSDHRCTTGDAPVRVRDCGTSICNCEGGLACSATCTASSSATSDLGCGVLVDGAVLSAWTSGAPPPQWLEYDLGQVRTLAEFSLTSGTCTVCTFQEGPSVISLQATNLPPESNGRAWYELRSPFSVGSMWSSGETRRWNLPEGEVRSFRYWRLNFHETMGGGGTVYKVHVSEVGLYAPATTFRLVVGEWGVCEPLGGYGACGAGVSRRSVQCFDDEDYPQSLDNCEHGLTTAAEMSCTVDCPILLVAGAIPHPGFFGVLRVSMTAQWMAKVLCAAYEVPIGDEPSATNLDYALYSGIGMAESTNGTAEVWGILVSRFAGEEFEVRCKVVGGSQVFGRGKRAVLRPVPLLMGCWADSFSDPDLPEYQGVQTQVSCADVCFGTQYFGLQMRGKCHCGDSYGRYGPKTPNRTAGLTGCDCNGPYYAYQANCVWEQSGGRFGDETMLPLRIRSVTANSAQMLASVEEDARVRCNVSSTDATSAPTTSAVCTNQGCALSMGNLQPSTTYTLSCEAEADDEHRSPRVAVLLVRTLDPELPPITMTPTRAPLDLSEPFYVLSTTAAPVIRVQHGLTPWDWLWIPSTLIGCLTLGLSIHCCARGRPQTVLQNLELPHTFWLVWELLIVADVSLGVAFLLDLLHARFAREAPYWDELSVIQAAILLFAASLHGAAFLFFGVLPAAGRCLAYEVLKRRDGHSWTLLRYKNVQHRIGTRRPQQTALPPELDSELSPSALHYLPGASLLAVCRASEEDLDQVLPYKIGINAFHFVGSLFQFLCAAYYTSHPWDLPASIGVSVACMCIFLLLAIFVALVLLRAQQVRSSGLLPLPHRLGAISADDAPAPPRVGLKGASKSAQAPRSLGKAQSQRRT